MDQRFLLWMVVQCHLLNYLKKQELKSKKPSGEKQGDKDRKDESIAMRVKKKRTPKQLMASRDESYGRWGSKAKKPRGGGRINV